MSNKIPCARHTRSLLHRGVSLAFILAALFLSAVGLPSVSAETRAPSVGVTPATVEFREPPLLPNGTKSGVLQFQQRYDRPVEVHVATTRIDSGPEDAHQWVHLERSGAMELAPGTHAFPYRIEVPPATPNGLYQAGVAFKAIHPEPAPQEGSSAVTEASVTASLMILIDDANEVKRVRVEGAPTVAPTEVGTPLRVTVPMTNTGNVDVVPVLRLEIQDRLQEQIVQRYEPRGSVMAPGIQQDQVFTVADHGLAEGQYWAVVYTLVDDEVVHTAKPTPFDVLAPGELARQAELRSIRIDDDLTAVKVGQMVRLTAIVVNVGEAPLVAEFDGSVARNGGIVGALTSKPLEVAPGETAELAMLYRVEEAGKYEFKGRVHYGAKVTEEKSVLLTATQDAAAVPSVGPGLLVGLLLVVAVVFRVAAERPVSRRRS